nr:hypothetical protein CFP56_56410 [Quercus suber]
MKGGGWDKKVGSRPSMANQRRVLCFGKQEAFQRSSLRCPWFQCAERSFETEHKPPISDLSDFLIFFFHFSNSGIMDLLRKGLLVDLHRPLGLREGKQHPFLDEVLHDLICVGYLFLATILLFFYLLCLKLERMDWFQTLFDRVRGSLSGKALSFPLRGWGCCCSARLALTVGFTLQALLTSEGFTNMMAPSGGSVTTWKEDTHEIDVLLESFSGTKYTGSSVDQPIAPPMRPLIQSLPRGKKLVHLIL